jgi:hypothetical protein
VVCWLLSCSKDTNHIVASACLGKHAFLYLFFPLCWQREVF